MHILVTGGCGFVGRHFTKHFMDEGHEVEVVDNMISGIWPTEWLFKPNRRINWWHEDCRQFFHRESAHEFDLIIHCAAIVGGRLKIDGDPLAVATDLSIDAEFFNWCCKRKPLLPKKVIYFSSSAVYPVELQTEQDHTELWESMVNFDSPQISMPDQTYGWSKLSGEYLAKFAVENYGLDVVIYRPFSGYGEDQSLDYPLPAIVKRVVDGEDPVMIWGSGEQQRDFIHIDDIVGAVCASMNAMRSGEVMNLGRGRPITFRDIALNACFAMGSRPKILNDPDKPEGVFSRVANSDRMLQFYRPKVPLKEGVERTVRYFKKQLTTA